MGKRKQCFCGIGLWIPVPSHDPEQPWKEMQRGRTAIVRKEGISLASSFSHHSVSTYCVHSPVVTGNKR